MTRNTLVCPFLNSDPLYAFGVEFGILWAKMQGGECDEIADFFTRDNQDQILLAASRLGWTVAEIKPRDKCWFWCRLEKTPAPA